MKSFRLKIRLKTRLSIQGLFHSNGARNAQGEVTNLNLHLN